ncbi:PhoH family protein, partial [Vibrio sp.]|uniref:PhoH family protein n=1 Tax=Vibrio sp. TaxID=678 RepID=UPI003D0C5D6B
IETFYDVKINNRSNHFEVNGDGRSLKKAKNLIQTLYNVAGHEVLSPASVQLYLNDNIEEQSAVVQTGSVEDAGGYDSRHKKNRGKITGRGKSQQQYLQQITDNDLTIGVGPAGTGKTYLAVACAVEALETDQVHRLILVRPAVEAGERLGFLPGDLVQKIDPYLRPMYDALFEMMGQQKVAKCLERNIIEIAPLAYMRGRTLNDSF